MVFGIYQRENRSVKSIYQAQDAILKKTPEHDELNNPAECEITGVHFRAHK